MLLPPHPHPVQLLTECTKDLSRCLLSRLKDAGLEKSVTSGVPWKGKRDGQRRSLGGVRGIACVGEPNLHE